MTIFHILLKRKLLLWLGAALITSGLTLALLPDSVKVWARSSAPKSSPPISSVASMTATPASALSATAPTSPRALRAADLLQTKTLPYDSVERRLLEIFASIEQGDVSSALTRSGALTRDHPNYQLGQLVHGDLLKLRSNPDAQTAQLGGVAGVPSQAAQTNLAALRTETRKRLDALHNRPPEGAVPHQFVALSNWSRHAIAIDASQSRLYLFENQASNDKEQGTQLKLVADFFMSVGKAGIGKMAEGDGRTPLGNYYITSVRERATLPPLYGIGALPINYPNAFDVQSERTGFGIWLHGTPPEQFVRAPLASDGCVVLSNPDMQHLLNTVAPRSTPVVIADRLQWTDPSTLTSDREAFKAVLAQWQQARSEMDASDFFGRYGTPRTLLTESDNAANQRSGRPAADESVWLVRREAKLGVTHLSLLQSQHPQPSMVATFEETLNGQPTGVMRRQYWHQPGGQWKLLQDTVLSGTPSAQLKRAVPTVALASASSSRSEAATAASAPQKASPSAPATSKPNASTLSVNSDEEAVKQAVHAWANAWASKNMAAYLAAYDAQFETPKGQNRKAWEQERKDRIVYKTRIEVQLSRMAIRMQGNQATVRFVQNYRADQLNVSSRKTLTMVRKGKHWLIAQEQVGR